MIAGLPIQLVSPPLARRRDTAPVALLRAALEGEAAAPAPTLVIAPAGLVCVETEDDALEQAEQIRSIARRSGAALLFGIEVGPPQPGSGRLFACLGGAPAIWPAQSYRAFPTRAESRIVRIGGACLLPLFAPEALDPAAPRRIAALARVDLIVVLSHGGATARWAPALARLERLAPLIVATHHGGVGRGYASPQLAASWLPIGVATLPLASAA